ncbi:hypothetical protein SAY87_022968 [Trapa incisa]|uniref:Uncharacterized protein n=1 Tax=Trapa incisa TaxID=236973 RepID=A0AAN7K570_9MYRT|nr:hypothetical protein SAY87_022968 [Trapa incisa]
MKMRLTSLILLSLAAVLGHVLADQIFTAHVDAAEHFIILLHFKELDKCMLSKAKQSAQADELNNRIFGCSNATTELEESYRRLFMQVVVPSAALFLKEKHSHMVWSGLAVPAARTFSLFCVCKRGTVSVLLYTPPREKLIREKRKQSSRAEQ